MDYILKKFELKQMGFNKLSHILYDYYYYFENIEMWNNVKLNHGNYTKIYYKQEELGITKENTIRTGTITAKGISYIGDY